MFVDFERGAAGKWGARMLTAAVVGTEAFETSFEELRSLEAVWIEGEGFNSSM